MRLPAWMRRTVRYRGPLKIVETNGTWGVYAGERLVLGDGTAVEDDLGIRIRKAFQPGAAEALERGGQLPEAFELPDVRIKIKRRGRLGR